MSHAILSSACSHCPEHVGKCSFKCNEEKAVDRDQSSSWFWHPTERRLVSDCVSFFQSVCNPAGRHKSKVILLKTLANTLGCGSCRADIESRPTARFLHDDDIDTPF